MRRLELVASVLLFAALCLQAALPVTTHFLGENVGFRYHWRVAPKQGCAAEWGVVWNMADSANYDAAELKMADARYTDAFGRQSAELHVVSVRGGRTDVIARRQLTVSDGAVSLVLERKPYAAQAMLYAGASRADVSVPVDVAAGLKLGGYAIADVDTLRATFDCNPIDAPVYARFADVDSLRAYLESSADIREAEWRYHDRDTDPVRVSLGGDYRLATVADGRGGYQIVYIRGAEDEGLWPPLRVKGWLTPTGFIDEFDLRWLDANGESMGSDCSAEFMDGSLLTVSFPLYKSRVRFRRVTGTDRTK